METPPEVQEQAGRVIQRLRASSAHVKWVDAGQLHWTIKFLGNVELDEVPEICDALSVAVAGAVRAAWSP